MQAVDVCMIWLWMATIHNLLRFSLLLAPSSGRELKLNQAQPSTSDQPSGFPDACALLTVVVIAFEYPLN